jgi:hypothetical protein
MSTLLEPRHANRLATDYVPSPAAYLACPAPSKGSIVTKRKECLKS